VRRALNSCGLHILHVTATCCHLHRCFSIRRSYPWIASFAELLYAIDMEPATWTRRDLAIVEALTVKVTVLTLSQIASHWWQPSKRRRENASRRLLAMERSGLLERRLMNGHPLLQATKPLASWQPGCDAPDPDAVAKLTHARWKEAPIPYVVYSASPLAANLFGSYHAKPVPMQLTHDLHLGEVYLLYRSEQPDEAERWVGEHVFGKAGFHVKDPDAFICDKQGKAERVIEHSGRYSRDQIWDFHIHCKDRDLPYELW